MTRVSDRSMIKRMVRHSPKNEATQISKAATTVLTNSDTISKNPTPKTNPTDRNRARTICHNPPNLLRFGIPQMRSSEFCSSTNTDDAPMIRATTPISVAKRLLPRCVVLKSSVCTADAPASPKSICICGRNSARTVSVLVTRPSTPIAMIRMGATENTV